MNTRCIEPGCTGTYEVLTGQNVIDEGLGLPVLLLNVVVRVCGTCGARSTILPGPRKYARLVAEQLVAKRGRLTPAEFKVLRQALGKSPPALASSLHVARQLVTGWEKGARPIPAHRDAMLRILFLAETNQTGQAQIEASLERPFVEEAEGEAEPYRVAV